MNRDIAVKIRQIKCIKYNMYNIDRVGSSCIRSVLKLYQTSNEVVISFTAVSKVRCARFHETQAGSTALRTALLQSIPHKSDNECGKYK
jgi:hypothetical protein